jgi:DNA-binding CsgD family transcriptional regulator
LADCRRTRRGLACTPMSKPSVTIWRAQIASLSPREHTALELAAAGLRSREIAERLGISEATVKSHLRRVYLKLGVTNRVQATSRYVRAARGGDEG